MPINPEIATTLKQIEQHLLTISQHIANAVDALSGAATCDPPAADQPIPHQTQIAASPSNEPAADKKKPIRAMIMEALRDAQDRGEPGLPPKGLKLYIRNNYGTEAGMSVNAIASKMFHNSKEIDKDFETGRYRLFPERLLRDAAQGRATTLS